MKSLQILFVSAVFLFTVFTGCKIREPQVQPDAAVMVNDVPIWEQEVAMRMQQLVGHKQPETPDLRNRIIDDLVADELLFQKGRRLGLDRDAKFRQTVKLMEMRLREFKRAEVARRVRSTQIGARVAVSEEDVRKYYDRRKESITSDYRLFLMRFQNESSAIDARNRLLQGGSFEAVASEMLLPALKARKTPWDTGLLHWDQLPGELVETVDSLSVGEVSSVLGSPHAGWYIVKLIEKTRNPDSGYEQMSASIMNRLRDQKLKDAYHRYLEELKQDAHIEKNDERRTAP